MLAKIIRQRREQSEISQEKLAGLIGVSRQTVSKWERGQAVPTDENLERIEVALNLPLGILKQELNSANLNLTHTKVSAKQNYLLWGACALMFILAAFYVGRISVPKDNAASNHVTDEVTINFHTLTGSAEGAQVILPVEEDGTVSLDMHMAHPGEEYQLAAALAYYQWPEFLPMEKQAVIDFDINPPGRNADEQLAAGWEVISQIFMSDEAELGLGRSEEAYDGSTLWVLGRSGPSASWTVLERIDEALIWQVTGHNTEAWAAPVGNVLGYDGVLVQCGERGMVFALVEGEPRTIFHLSNSFQGFADLDFDGELEIVCGKRGAYEIYDREPNGYYCYTLPEDMNGLHTPDDMWFIFRQEERAFGFAYSTSTKLNLNSEAPLYDQISANGYLWRRDGVRDERSQAGRIGGTTVSFQIARPDEVRGWALDGTPLLTTRQQGAIVLHEMEALTGYRPERCYISGDYAVSLEQNGDYRTFFSMSLPDPTHYENGWLHDCSNEISILYLNWQDEWSPWSPLKKENVELPADWDTWIEEQRGLWWYQQSDYFMHGEIVSIEPAQYEGMMKINLVSGDFLEISLTDDGYLSSMYGPYPKGTTH